MGTEAFWVPAAVAALGTGAQYVNTSNANKRADSAEAQAIIDQQQIQQRAGAAVNKTVKDIAASNPNKIAGQATGDYVAALRRNAAGASTPGSNSALAPVAGASSRYNSDVKSAQAGSEAYGNTLADEMGAVDAATRQRQNEGLEMLGLNTKLNTLGAESYGTNFVDQLRAQTAGTANPWISLLSGMLTRGATSYQPSQKQSTRAPGSLFGGTPMTGPDPTMSSNMSGAYA